MAENGVKSMAVRFGQGVALGAFRSIPFAVLRGFVVALFCGLLLSSSPVIAASANDIPWSGQKFRYTATQKNLRDLLVEFGIANGVNIVVAPEIDKIVSVRFNDPPQVVINSLASSYGLIWFYDGNVLYIEPATSARTEVIRMSYGRVDELLGLLRRIKIPEGRYRLNADTEQNLLIVSGPSRYVELVRSLAQSLDSAHGSRRQTAVKVFPLKRAWAADFRVKQNGKDIEMPGVVSMLRKLYSPAAAKPEEMSSALPPVQSPAFDMRVLQAQQAAEKAGRSPLTPRLPMGVAGASMPASVRKEVGLPSFEADPSSNSVLVRDYSDRIDQYASVIDGLDQGGGLIEIEVTIMDISSNAFGRLGVDWSLYSARLDSIGLSGLFGSRLGIPGTDGLLPLGDRGALYPGGNLPRVTGLAANAVIGGPGRQLVAKVSALEESGQGRIVARPKVLTMNNVEAVLENTETFYVKSEGAYSANLFDVTAGTTVRVLPLVLSRGGSSGVKMAIAIEDGGILEQTDSNIPRIKRSSINTQAVVGEGESVLLAGYSIDKQDKRRTGVPGLSSLPIIGALFGTAESNVTRADRYYLVTPRIIRPIAAFERGGADER
ncbi:MAG: type secretion protein [Pseudomonadota bacterium]|jgi:type III secretion protein C